MKRRRLLAATASAPLIAGAASASAQQAPADAPAFVLVHGTWHGGWVWQKVRERLRARGFTVFTPTNTGTGERHHLASPDVGLDTHIEDVANVIRWEELTDVILVGHAAGGLVITGVADRLREQVRFHHLVFFDAKVPRPGDMSFVNTRTEQAAAFLESRRAKWKDGWLMNFYDGYSLDMLAAPEETEVRALLERRLTTQPAGPWVDELVLERGGYDGLPKTFVVPAAQTHIPTPESFYGPLLDDPEWAVERLPVQRNGMLTEPDIFTDFLAGLVA